MSITSSLFLRTATDEEFFMAGYFCLSSVWCADSIIFMCLFYCGGERWFLFLRPGELLGVMSAIRLDIWRVVK